MPDTYRVLVTGSRDWKTPTAIYTALDEVLAVHHPIVLVHGRCPRGADAMAGQWAVRRRMDGVTITVEPHAADWDRYGKAAGFRRNAEMVGLGADLCVAFIAECRDPKCRRTERHGSHGATQCADLAEAAAIPVRRITDT